LKAKQTSNAQDFRPAKFGKIFGMFNFLDEIPTIGRNAKFKLGVIAVCHTTSIKNPASAGGVAVGKEFY
jgi:hypothetical protein